MKIKNFIPKGMVDQVACFHFLYFGLKLGKDILPLETCMFYAGIYITRLTTEINQRIGHYVYDDALESCQFLSHDGITLLRQFANNQPLLFANILLKLLHALNNLGKKKITLNILNREI